MVRLEYGPSESQSEPLTGTPPLPLRCGDRDGLGWTGLDWTGLDWTALH